MNNYDYEIEKNKHPYREANVLEEKHGNATFLLRDSLSYVVDSYDENIASIELSHYENNGYKEVVNFNTESDESTLDLTWMNENDVFTLQLNEQYPSIKEIKVNIDNLGYSFLPYSEDLLKSFNVIINGKNQKKNIISQIKDFTYFIISNNQLLKGIKLEGFNPAIETLLSAIAKKHGVQTYKEIENTIIK